ncbi:MAG: hypothetical protein ABIK43_03150 [candidate division WOR-3 bacterium]
MKIVSAEQIWRVYPNRYLALNVAALECRRIIDAIQRGEMPAGIDPCQAALERVARNELRHARLTEEELAAMSRESYEDQFGRQ